MQDYTTEGFVVHPAKIAISLPFKDPLAKHEGVFAEAPEEVKALLTELRTATTSQDALKHLQALQSEKWINALETKINELEGKVARQPLFEKTTRPVIEAAKLLKKKIGEALSQIETLLDHPTEPGRLELLIHVKTLETLLFQQPSSPGALAQHSRLSIEESFAAADAIMLYQSQLPHAAHFADLLMDGSQSPVEEAFSDWQAFLLKLEPLAEKTFNGESTGLTRNEISRFKTVLHTMRQAGVLPLFMTFFLGNISQASGDPGIAENLKVPVEILRTLITLLPSRDEPIIEEIFVRKKEIQQLRNDLGQIANPKAYPEIFGRLQKAVDNFLPAKQSWLQKEQWQAASPIARSIAIESMNELVDVYDTAIKAMKASQEIKSDIEKTQKFKEMLGPYLELLKGWSQQTVGEENYVLFCDENLRKLPLELYIKRIEQELLKLSDTDPNQLSASLEFSVSAAVLGSGTAVFKYHLPKTLEDVFTLIHQNLLVSTATLTKGLFSFDQVINSPLPDVMKKALGSTSKISRNGVGNPQLIGIKIDKTGIIFYYNVPLRHHSGKFSIQYDRKTEKVSMEAQFLGVILDGRWDRGAERVAILSAAGIIPLQSKLKVTPQELTFSWDISQPDHLDPAIDEYQKQVEISLKGYFKADVTEFIREVDNHGSLYDACLLFSKARPVSDFGRELVALFVNKTIDNLDESILNSDYFLKIVLRSYRDPRDIRSDRISDGLIKVMKALFAQNKGIQGAIAAVKEGIKDENDKVRMDSNKLWKALIEQNKGIPEAIAAAKEGIKDDGVGINDGLRDSSFRLWEALIEQNKGIPEAIAAAKEGIKTEKFRVHNSILRLWNALIEQNKGIPEAIAAAQEGIKHKDDVVRDSSIKLLTALVKQNKGIPEAIVAAQEGIKDDSNRVQNSSIDLLIALVEQNKGIPEAITAAQGYGVRDSSLRLWRALLKQNKGIPEAIAAAQGYGVRDSSLRLWRALLKQNKGIPEAIAAAQEGVKDESNDVRDSSINLFTALVEQNKGILEAVAAAKVYGARGDTFINLLIALVKQNKCIPEAIAAAQDYGAISSSSSRLWSALLKQNKGIPEATAIALKGLNGYMHSESYLLFLDLVRQKESIPEVIAFIQEGIKGKDWITGDYSIDIWLKLLTSPQGKLAAQKLVDEGLLNPDGVDPTYLNNLKALREYF